MDVRPSTSLKTSERLMTFGGKDTVLVDKPRVMKMTNDTTGRKSQLYYDSVQVVPADSAIPKDVRPLTSIVPSERPRTVGDKENFIFDKPGVTKMTNVSAKGILGSAPTAQARYETSNEISPVSKVLHAVADEAKLPEKPRSW
ncbi:hypothetical protein CDL15_Pgr012978 [Punica granatum]|uniref:Uncharacterized protein n=1 Tax=Punica granatum TaxID=22663 RepID=A0A218XEX2_PUNGR|nr:hypothetical protein CDL15_Pgr012978 [Punica granatum]